MTEFHRGQGRARSVPHPDRPGLRGWRAAAVRVGLAFVNDDDLWSVSAGVAFYVWFAAIFGMVFLVSLYALAAGPGTVRAGIDRLGDVLPAGAVRFLADQMQSLADASSVWLGARLAGALLVALWSARAAVASLIAALNIAHTEREERGFLHLQAVTLALTAASAVFGTGALALLLLLPRAADAWAVGSAAKAAITFMRWPLMALLMGVGVGMFYRFGPSRSAPQWRWVSGGAVAATALWIGGSAAFSWYVELSFSSSRSFGALSAVLVMQSWFYISALAVLIGAKLNAEAEHETAAGGCSNQRLTPSVTENAE